MEISRMGMDKKHTSFEVGWRWRVQEQLGGGWVLIDRWYDEEVVSSESYEDAFKAIARFNESAEEEKEKMRLAGISTLKRVAGIIGIETTMDFVGAKDIDEKYRVCIAREYYDVYEEKRAHTRMSLVRKDKKNEEIACEFIEDDFTDRMITNRYNKLMAEIEA